VQLLQEVLLRKQPGDDGAVAWHRDASYLGYLDPVRVVSLRLALSPCTRAHGCLLVLDGSHRWTYDAPPRTGAAAIADALADLPPDLRARVPDALAAVELAPGDASMHDARTLHGSGPNRAGGVRRTLVVHAFDAACRLVPARLPLAAARRRFPTDAGGHLTGASFPLLPLRPDAYGRS
jgi:ectoine hydroxylase-related dioxygenase (phytanoyl-CoA dioxygenase family)